MSGHEILFSGVSKFYGEVLGVSRIDLAVGPGLTALVGPNGSGKSTVMNLMTGLLKPDRGTLSVLGIDPRRSELLFRSVGYATQWDTFPAGCTGASFLTEGLLLHGHTRAHARQRSSTLLERFSLTEAADRRVAGYSKGMKQRLKLAHCLAHGPRILILDEPLNGLDPTGRAEIIDLLSGFAEEGRIVVVSSHILHEVDLIADTVVMIHGGRVVAEGGIREVREEIVDQPIQVLVRCNRSRDLAARVFALPHVVQARLVDEGATLLVSTTDSAGFFVDLAEIVTTEGLIVDSVTPADESVRAVYDYLIGTGMESS